MNKKQKTVPVKYSYRPRTPEVLKSLSCEPQWLLLLKDRNNPYDSIIDDLFSIFEEINKEEYSDFIVKDFSTRLNVKTDQLSKWINKIYDDIFNLNANEPQLFQSEGIKYKLSFTGFSEIHAYLTLWLNAQPQVGNQFFFPFINAKCNSSFFNIVKVDHHYYCGKSSSSVYLTTDTTNIYRDFIKDKALFYNKIGVFAAIFPGKELDDQLKDLYPHKF